MLEAATPCAGQVLRLTTDAASGSLTVTTLPGLEDHNRPLAPGALHKCAPLFRPCNPS